MFITDTYIFFFSFFFSFLRSTAGITPPLRRSKRGVVHLYNMVVCATGCNPLAYKGYGCYCGFLGSGFTIDGIDRWAFTNSISIKLLSLSTWISHVSCDCFCTRKNWRKKPIKFSAKKKKKNVPELNLPRKMQSYDITETIRIVSFRK